MFHTEQAREQVAAEIRAQMGRLKISAKDLAESTGVAPATLSRKLNAKAGFTVEELVKIARVLGVPAATFFGGVDAA